MLIGARGTEALHCRRGVYLHCMRIPQIWQCNTYLQNKSLIINAQAVAIYVLYTLYKWQHLVSVNPSKIFIKGYATTYTN